MQVSSILFAVGAILVICISIPMAPIILHFAHAQSPKDNNHVDWILFITFLSVVMLINSIFDVLQIAIETIFVCGVEDYERNDGSSARPYYMNEKLKSLLFNE